MGWVSELKRKIHFFNAKRFYGRLVKKGDLCFDIGANAGEKTSLFLSLGAKVIAVEPQSSCIKILNELKIIHGDRLMIIPKAVSDKSGKAVLHIGNVNLVSTLSEKFMERFKMHEDLNWEKRETVELITLDELIAAFGEPNFCKIDTEGFELNVLQGLNKKIPMIEFEFTSLLLDEAKKCIEELTRFGEAEYNYIFYERTKFEMAEWCDKRMILDELDKIPMEIVHGNIYVRFKE